MKAPPHLTAASRKWWRAIASTHQLPEHRLRLLTLAAEALDRCDQARQVIAVEGLTVKTRDGGLKTHPACRVERDARIGFARLMRTLALDNGPAIDEQRLDQALKPWRPQMTREGMEGV